MSLETIYKAVRILHWLHAMQRKDEPAYYPYIQAYCRKLLHGYEETLQAQKEHKNPVPAPQFEG